MKDNTVIGVGTGSTVAPFIEYLNRRVEEEQLSLTAIPTSVTSERALHKGIKIGDLSLCGQIDITVDGADRVSSDFYMIKGGGGALLREKFVALNSLENITIVDPSKIITPLGGFALPIEIVPYGYKTTISRLNDLSFNGLMRMSDNSPYKTDNGNYIIDLDVGIIKDPATLHFTLKQVSGVIETGLFLKTSNLIIIGQKNDSVDIWRKEGT